jgi:hypothetical protein
MGFGVAAEKIPKTFPCAKFLLLFLLRAGEGKTGK